MNDLIEALNIFKKYVKEGTYEYDHPFHCEHDELMFCAISDADVMSDEDIIRLSQLGFDWSGDGHFYSFRFGSC